MAKLFIILLTFTLASTGYAQAPEGWEAQGPNVRVMRHQDGSRTLYRRTPGKKTLVKKNVGTDGKVRTVTQYHMDDYGNPRACKIYDSSNKLLFKVSYAYEISTGRLVAERMLYADKVQTKTGQPLVASETRYTYDAQGNRSKPITITFMKGKTAEELFGNGKVQSTFPEKTFDDQKFLANPNATKVGGN